MTYRPTAVYLMRNEWAESNYKIGVSNHPYRRHFEVEEQYQNVSPIVVTVCWFASQKQALKAESIWHKRLKDKRTDDHGGKEWFSLSQQDIDEFTQWSSISKSDTELKDWLFRLGASMDSVNSYFRNLVQSIPRKSFHPRIETWFSPKYFTT